MSLDKAIQSGREHRKPYRRSKVFDPACRNHKSCPWCQGNRTIQARREHDRANVKETDDEADLCV